MKKPGIKTFVKLQNEFNIDKFPFLKDQLEMIETCSSVRLKRFPPKIVCFSTPAEYRNHLLEKYQHITQSHNCALNGDWKQ